MERECPRCGATYRQFSTIQTRCKDCYREKLKARLASQTPTRSAPLKRRQRPIKQQGKRHHEWITFRDKVLRPYLDKKYGLVCFDCGVMPAMKDDGTYYRHDCDHILGRGAHPELRLVVTNFVYRCRACHIKKTGVPQWTKR